MKHFKILLLATALVFPLANAVSQTAPHEHEAVAHGSMELNAGQKWATDAPLRQGMTKIRTAVLTALPAAQSGSLTPAQYDVFADDVNSQVVYIVQNCKLEPKADAQLHVLLGDITTGVSVAKGEKQGEARSQGVIKVAESVNNYGKYFDHADLQPIAVPH
jgi:hypothetical protein